MTALPQDEATSRPADIAAENVRLRAELAAALARQTATGEILLAVANTSGDADQSLQRIAEITARLFEAPSVTIRIAGESQWFRTIRVGAWSQRVGAVPAAQLQVRGGNLPATVFQENRQIHIPDLDNIDPSMAAWPIVAARADGIRTVCGTPLRRDGKAIGALVIYRNKPVPFTPEELALQQSFADQAVIAIENARLFNETQQALARQTATSEILRVISGSPTDVQPVFDTIVLTAARLFRRDLAFILGCDATTYWPVATAGPEGLRTPPDPSPVAIDTDANFPSRVIVSRKNLHLPDWSAIELPEYERMVHERLGMNSALYLPLLREGECIGLLGIAGKQAGIFGESEIALAESFRDQALIAIENTRLFNETKEALERQTATADILKVIASSPSDVQPVFEAIATSANRLLGGFSTSVYRFIDAALHLMAFTPTNAAADKAFRATFPAPVADIPLLELVHAGKVAQVADTEAASTDTRLTTIARSRGFRSMLFTPLISNGVAIGMIGVTRPEPGSFAAHHVQLLQTFADQAVIAIENVRLFDEVQTRTRELSQSLDELRTAQDRLVQTEKLASLGQLTAGIAHEIKNPLNFVNNFSSLSAELIDELNDVLKQATLNEKIREEVDELTGLLKDNLEKVVQHGKRADSIVKNMLLHSREGSGDHRPADINALLDESLNLAYHGARAEKPQFNVTLQRNFDETAGEIEVFPQEITRVFLNLISNGFYAVTKRKAENGSPDFEPAVMAATRNLGGSVEIRIRDNGTGIPAEVREKMFNPFFTTKPAGEGTGLGLSMSYDIIVKQHRGTIDVETKPGEFTEFRIVLPRTGNVQEKSKEESREKSQEKSQEKPQEKKRGPT
jgi:two-component system, NtrC family, sensor kinase